MEITKFRLVIIVLNLYIGKIRLRSFVIKCLLLKNPLLAYFMRYPILDKRILVYFLFMNRINLINHQGYSILACNMMSTRRVKDNGFSLMWVVRLMLKILGILYTSSICRVII